MNRSVLVLVAALASSCAYDWDRYDPRSADAAQQEDSAACGAAGMPCCGNRSCATGLVCAMGVCEACPEGRLACGGACVDTSSNDEHCGRCNNSCRGNTNCTNSDCR
jgi:hypothetical protein